MKKYLPVIFCFMALLLAIPAGGLAEGSGMCGDQVRWILHEGVLTISGQGDMTDFYRYHETEDPGFAFAPWYQERNGIRQVIIEEGVTGIGAYAFTNCESLTAISIPASVTKMGSSAVHHCKSLKEFAVPNGVKAIDIWMFSGCDSLTNVTIPGSVTRIEASAFRLCKSLAGIVIPESVQFIGDSAFDGCEQLKTIVICGRSPVLGKYAIPYLTRDIQIYCYKDSDVDAWATGRGYAVSYLDGMEAAAIRALVLRPASTPVPTAEPTVQPTVEPTAAPTAEPTAMPTSVETLAPAPTPEPTAAATAVPTAEPTPEPTAAATAVPTAEPTPEPTAAATAVPTAEPTPEPTPAVTAAPTPEPTVAATAVPTAEPTSESTAAAAGASPLVPVPLLPAKSVAVPSKVKTAVKWGVQIQAGKAPNVRKGPSAETEWLGVVRAGELFELLDVSDDEKWYRIEWKDGSFGWVTAGMTDVVTLDVTPIYFTYHDENERYTLEWGCHPAAVTAAPYAFRKAPLPYWEHPEESTDADAGYMQRFSAGGMRFEGLPMENLKLYCAFRQTDQGLDEDRDSAEFCMARFELRMNGDEEAFQQLTAALTEKYGKAVLTEQSAADGEDVPAQEIIRYYTWTGDDDTGLRIIGRTGSGEESYETVTVCVGKTDPDAFPGAGSAESE